jgi:hypothetical protein
MKYYAGIGARKTPKDVLEEFKCIACKLAYKGYILRSGGADGADSAFEEGCNLNSDIKYPSEVFLPWKDFNNNKSIRFITNSNRGLLFNVAKDIYPDWDNASYGVKLLHARNVQQVLGEIPSISEPTSFVICWTDRNPTESRGTMFAVNLAKMNNIKVYNFYIKGDREKFYKEILDQEI